MHELSITRSLLDQALTETKKRGYKRINRIHLLLGEGGGIVPDCVQFYFDEMKKGTAAAQAELEFKRVPLRIRCPKCGAEWGMGPDLKTGLSCTELTENGDCIGERRTRASGGLSPLSVQTDQATVRGQRLMPPSSRACAPATPAATSSPARNSSSSQWMWTEGVVPWSSGPVVE